MLGWLRIIYFLCLTLGTAQGFQQLMENGNSLYLSGRLTQATQVFKEAAHSNPDKLVPLLDLAAILRESGKNKEAIKALEIALFLSPQNPDILRELGWLKFNSGDLAGAKPEFEAASRLHPGDPLTHLGLAATLIELKKPEEAIPVLKHLQSSMTSYAVIDYLLGKAYFLANKDKEAAERLIQASRKDFAFSEPRLLLADVHLKLGDPDAAWKQYSKLLQVDTQHPYAIQMSNKIKSRLTQSPEELLPAVKIASPTSVESIPDLEKMPKLRVGLGTSGMGKPNRREQVYFWSAGPFRILGTKTNTVYAEGTAGETWRVRCKSGNCTVYSPQKEYGPFKYPFYIQPISITSQTIIVQEIPQEKGLALTSFSDREYRDTIEISPQRRGGMVMANLLTVEEYLLGVLPSEVPKTWPMEALKAQAIIARNQIFIRQKYMKPHQKLYDLCDTQHCQVYRGVKAESTRTKQAVEETRGMVLYYKDRLAQSLYHSTCGGETQDSSEVGWGHTPYLTRILDGDPQLASPPHSPWEFLLWIKGFPQVYCKAPEYSSFSEFRWLRIISHRDMEIRLNREYHIGKLLSIIPVQRSPSGNVNAVWVIGSRKKITIKREHLIRRNLGRLRSTLFLIDTRKDAAGNPLEYWVYGGGWGHGIGLCQTGSATLAGKMGKTYQEILEHYYPGTHIKKLEY